MSSELWVIKSILKNITRCKLQSALYPGFVELFPRFILIFSWLWLLFWSPKSSSFVRSPFTFTMSQPGPISKKRKVPTPNSLYSVVLDDESYHLAPLVWDVSHTDVDERTMDKSDSPKSFPSLLLSWTQANVLVVRRRRSILCWTQRILHPRTRRTRILRLWSSCHPCKNWNHYSCNSHSRSPWR